MAYNFTLKCAEERLLSVRQIGCVVALKVLEEVLACVHTVKNVTCKEDKVGAGVRHDRTKNIGESLVTDVSNSEANHFVGCPLDVAWAFLEEDVVGSNAEDVTDLDQCAHTICAECIVKLLSVLNRIREDLEDVKIWLELADEVG